MTGETLNGAAASDASDGERSAKRLRGGRMKRGFGCFVLGCLGQPVYRVVGSPC